MRNVLSQHDGCLGRSRTPRNTFRRSWMRASGSRRTVFPPRDAPIVWPARARPGVEPRPFAEDPTAVDAILDNLSHARTSAVGQNRRYVEPVQLQLICRRMEQFGSSSTDGEGRRFDHHHGGSRRRSRAQQDCCATSTKKRSAACRIGASAARLRRLCKNHLISTEGRRLSLEEHEIYQQIQGSPGRPWAAWWPLVCCVPKTVPRVCITNSASMRLSSPYRLQSLQSSGYRHIRNSLRIVAASALCGFAVLGSAYSEICRPRKIRVKPCRRWPRGRRDPSAAILVVALWSLRCVYGRRASTVARTTVAARHAVGAVLAV